MCSLGIERDVAWGHAFLVNASLITLMRPTVKAQHQGFCPAPGCSLEGATNYANRLSDYKC